jgi:glycogen operon protein
MLPVEGPSDGPMIEAMRVRKIKNLLSPFSSRGVAVLGDEFRPSQSGNNNAYAQDKVISWYELASG